GAPRKPEYGTESGTNKETTTPKAAYPNGYTLPRSAPQPRGFFIGPQMPSSTAEPNGTVGTGGRVVTVFRMWVRRRKVLPPPPMPNTWVTQHNSGLPNSPAWANSDIWISDTRM